MPMTPKQMIRLLEQNGFVSVQMGHTTSIITQLPTKPLSFHFTQRI